jgi:AbiTii-like protein
VDLRDWATRELRGYLGSEDALPDYRHARAPLLMDGLSGNFQFRRKSVTYVDLPAEARDVITDEVPLTFGIGKIEDLSRQADSNGGFIQLGPPGASDLALLMSHESGGRYHVERVYWSVSASDLRSVVDAVRTALIELVAEMRAGMAGGDTAPSPEVTGQALQFAVYGKGHRITVATAGEGGTATATSKSAEPEEPGFWTTSRRIGAAIVGFAAIVTAVAAILALHPKL